MCHPGPWHRPAVVVRGNTVRGARGRELLTVTVPCACTAGQSRGPEVGELADGHLLLEPGEVAPALVAAFGMSRARVPAGFARPT